MLSPRFMLASTYAAALIGVHAHLIRVEAQVGRGLPGFEIVGLPEREVRESRVRVKAALQSCGIGLPPRRIIVNLAPGDIRKSGTAYDLAIAAAVLGASGQLDPAKFQETLLIGELGLGGELRPVRGALCLMGAARRAGLSKAMVPAANGLDASLAHGLEVVTAAHLDGALAHLNHVQPLEPVSPVLVEAPSLLTTTTPDLADVRGQAAAIRALEIAATGRHPLLMMGPPGAGKTMLARRLPTLLGPSSPEVRAEIADIQSAAGTLSEASVHQPPFRAPHHSVSTPSLIGGGEPIRPGEVTLAHGGVLFLDELPEFQRSAIESLRVTMECGEAHISRVHEKVIMPAAPLVIAAMNPCPCGYAGSRAHLCRCSPRAVTRYRERVSGPLLDRFDMQLDVRRVPAHTFLGGAPGEPSAVVRRRVLEARAFAAQRSAEAPDSSVTATCTREALEIFVDTVDRSGSSARSFHKLVRIARTIADLAASPQITLLHATEAIQYRSLERKHTEATTLLRRVQ